MANLFLGVPTLLECVFVVVHIRTYRIASVVFSEASIETLFSLVIVLLITITSLNTVYHSSPLIIGILVLGINQLPPDGIERSAVDQLTLLSLILW